MAGLRSRVCVLAMFSVLASIAPCWAQDARPAVDSDHDGLSDGLEQRLLEQFRPAFQVGAQDCAGLPAVFQPGVTVPTPEKEDGTIYGQVFARHGADPAHPDVEVHFYHLWDRDCGAHGHALDTEHVAVLLRASGSDPQTATWKAVYWYAAAHENTVCDVSQMARAATLGAEDHGAIVWISPGKHASYLDVALCSHGCGADRCEAMKPLPKGRVINLGEAGEPMNGSVFVGASQWPLAAKMRLTNFDQAALARAGQLPTDEIALYHPGKHPVQGVIAVSASTEAAIAQSEANTNGAMSLAGDKTTGSLATATDKTGDALGRSYRDTRHALGSSARHVGRALGMGKRQAVPTEPPSPQP